MVRSAQIHLTSLKNCLINLPLSIYAPLIERSGQITPQSLIIQLSFAPTTPTASPSGKSAKLIKVYVGWTGLPSNVVGVSSNQVRGGKGDLERIDIDPQFAAMLNPALIEGLPVSSLIYLLVS
jgi:peroxin-1